MATFTLYPQFKLKQNNGNAIDLDTDAIRYFIVTSAYTYSAAHDFVDDLTNHVTGTGAPTSSGVAITGVTFALDGDNPEFIFDDIVISQSGAGFADGRVLVLAQWSGAAATSKLIGRLTEASDFGNTGGPLTFDGSAATGWFNVT
jgi:hypothetical protein